MDEVNRWSEVPATTPVRMHHPEIVRDARCMGSRDTCMCKTSRCAAKDSTRVRGANASRGVRHECERPPLLDFPENALRCSAVASGAAVRLRPDWKRAGLFASESPESLVETREEG